MSYCFFTISVLFVVDQKTRFLSIKFTCIFSYVGNYDIIQQPKNIGNATKKIACFFMFVDEETEAYINNSTLTDSKLVGLWRLVIVKNLPYSDARRNGKVFYYQS